VNILFFFDEESNLLFAYQKISGELDSKDIGKVDVVKKWWNYMEDIMVTNPDNSPVSKNLEEVFYLE